MVSVWVTVPAALIVMAREGSARVVRKFEQKHDVVLAETEEIVEQAPADILEQLGSVVSIRSSGRCTSALIESWAYFARSR